MKQRLLVISPVFNEARHIGRVARAVAAQTRAPDLWLVIDDGSTDGTLELLRTLAQDIPFMRVLVAPEKVAQEPSDRLAAVLELRAFNAALRTMDLRSFTHIAKLDGDIELPPHWYAEQLARFEEDPRLGIAGGSLIEPVGETWKLLRIPSYHVHGAVKLYSRACFDEIGGLPERLAWDTIDETYARMRGCATRTFPDLVAHHLRPAASADGQLRGRARHGVCAWIAHYSFPWVLARSLKVAMDRPRLLSGLWFLGGYVRASLQRVPRVPDQEFRAFTRGELRSRVKHVLLGRRFARNAA